MHIFALEGYLRPSWAMWRHLGGHLGGILGYVGVSWENLGPCGGHLGGHFALSWGILGGLGLGQSVQKPGKIHISAVEGYLRPSWAMWPHLGGHLGGTLAYVGVSGGILGHLGAILEAILRYRGRSQVR